MSSTYLLIRAYIEPQHQIRPVPRKRMRWRFHFRPMRMFLPMALLKSEQPFHDWVRQAPPSREGSLLLQARNVIVVGEGRGNGDNKRAQQCWQREDRVLHGDDVARLRELKRKSWN